jgi:lipid-binding SYLF domain-containing protein
MLPMFTPRHALRAAAAGCALLLSLPASSARAQTAEGQQELVDRATLAVSDVLSGREGEEPRELLPQSRAVMICPRVFRAGFLFGGEGGGCVLVARGGQGSWSAPAFYSMGGGSFGLQAGIQDAEIVMMIRTEAGLRAVMDSQFRIGADASVAVVTVGGGVEGATSVALNADIVAFARTRGLFAGVSLQGSVMDSDSAGDQAYYGQPVGAIDIVQAMRVSNPGADPLRAALMRLGNPPPAPAYAAAPPPGYGQPQGYAQAPGYGQPDQFGPPPGYAAGGPAPVQSQSLPPPR